MTGGPLRTGLMIAAAALVGGVVVWQLWPAEESEPPLHADSSAAPPTFPELPELTSSPTDEVEAVAPEVEPDHDHDHEGEPEDEDPDPMVYDPSLPRSPDNAPVVDLEEGPNDELTREEQRPRMVRALEMIDGAIERAQAVLAESDDPDERHAAEVRIVRLNRVRAQRTEELEEFDQEIEGEVQ